MHLLLLASACWCAQALAESAPYYELEDADQHFADFITKFNKQYANEEEKAARFEIFKTNLEKINHSNKEGGPAVFAVTKFSDLSQEEFIKKHTCLREHPDPDVFCKMLTDKDISDEGAPQSFDWRTKHSVTPVKDQKDCGSCYAFSAIGNVESIYAKKTGQSVDLPEQQIVDCDKLSKGCDGGLPSKSFQELIRMGGCMKETDYPYENGGGKCRFDKSKVVLSISDCYSYDLRNQSKLRQLLYKNGPISVAISTKPLQLYSGGVIPDSKCDIFLTHAVLLVGSGIDDKTGMSYWILKNSWGEKWGENGYFRLQRDGTSSTASCKMMNKYMASSVI